MAKKKILMLIGDYAEDYEVMVAYEALLMVGHTVHAVCPGKKAGDKIKTSIHDFEGDQSYTEKVGHNFQLNAAFDEIQPEDYDAVIIPGGRAVEYIRLNPRVLVLKGRKCSAYPATGPDVTLAGGTWVDLPMDGAYTDGNLVTGPAWPALHAWLGQFCKVLGSRIEA
jgi:protease I